jgi:hypothetical protein
MSIYFQFTQPSHNIIESTHTSLYYIIKSSNLIDQKLTNVGLLLDMHHKKSFFQCAFFTKKKIGNLNLYNHSEFGYTLSFVQPFRVHQ